MGRLTEPVQYQYEVDSSDYADLLDIERTLYQLDQCFCPWLYNRDSLTKDQVNFSPYKYDRNRPIVLDVPDSTLKQWKELGFIKILKTQDKDKPVL